MGNERQFNKRHFTSCSMCHGVVYVVSDRLRTLPACCVILQERITSWVVVAVQLQEAYPQSDHHALWCLILHKPECFQGFGGWIYRSLPVADSAKHTQKLLHELIVH